MLVSLIPIPLLLRRVEVNTLLPGTVREEELHYYAHVQTAARKAHNQPALSHLSPAVVRAKACTMGYVTLLLAMSRNEARACLALLLLLTLPLP